MSSVPLCLTAAMHRAVILNMGIKNLLLNLFHKSLRSSAQMIYVFLLILFHDLRLKVFPAVDLNEVRDPLVDSGPQFVNPCPRLIILPI
jgi:hypothetical protein